MTNEEIDLDTVISRTKRSIYCCQNRVHEHNSRQMTVYIHFMYGKPQLEIKAEVLRMAMQEVTRSNTFAHKDWKNSNCTKQISVSSSSDLL